MRRLLLAVLLFSVAPITSGFAADRYQVEGYVLDNGLQLILKPGTEPGHVAIRLVVGVGFDDFSCADQETPHLLEHLMFSGLDARGEGGLEERMQALGGEWNAFTGNTDTTFVIEVPARNQRKALDLLLAALTQTRIDQQAMDTAKAIVTREDGGHGSHLQTWLDHQAFGHEVVPAVYRHQGRRDDDEQHHRVDQGRTDARPKAYIFQIAVIHFLLH